MLFHQPRYDMFFAAQKQSLASPQLRIMIYHQLLALRFRLPHARFVLQLSVERGKHEQCRELSRVVCKAGED